MEDQKVFPILAPAGPVREGVGRRRALQLMLGGASAVVTLPGIAASHPVHRHVNTHAPRPAAASASEAEWKPLFLDAHQNETLIVLAELLVPGAGQVHANRFIDLALSVESQESQDRFIRSLAAFDGEALARFRAPFRQLTPQRQIEILTAASQGERSPDKFGDSGDWVSVAARGHIQPPLVTFRDCFENLKGWVVGAYYSSENGMKELGWTGNTVYDEFPGCQHSEGHR